MLGFCGKAGRERLFSKDDKLWIVSELLALNGTDVGSCIVSTQCDPGESFHNICSCKMTTIIVPI